LMREYAELIRSKSPEPLRAMIAKVSNGRDLDAEYLTAGQEVARLKDQGMMLMGVTGGAGQSPAVDAEIDRNMPFSLLPPDKQAQISAAITARIKAGEPLDLTEARSRGVPVENIAAIAGMAIDPMTGMVTGKVTAAPAGGKPAPSPFGGGGFAAAKAGGAPGPMSMLPTMPPEVTPGASAVDVMQAEAGDSIVPMPGGNPGDIMARLAAMRKPSLAIGTPPAPPAPDPMRDFFASRTPGPGMNTPGFAPRPTSGNSTAIGLAMQNMTKPSPTRSISGITGASPAPDLGGFRLPQPGTQYGPQYMGLQSALSLPQAEQQARSLLDQGEEYESVVNAIPQQYRPLVAARLPKRLPTGGTQQY
jgi:hypothetical protein